MSMLSTILITLIAFTLCYYRWFLDIQEHMLKQKRTIAALEEMQKQHTTELNKLNNR